VLPIATIGSADVLIEIEDVLDAATVAAMRQRLLAADWHDGRATAGYQSALTKHNRQLDQHDPLAVTFSRSLAFNAAAIPARIYPPLFNRYDIGDAFGTHIDGAYRPLPDGSGSLRTDLSATLFLSDPADYDGGELVIEQGSRETWVKLPAGHMALYPATTLHRVEPVTRGSRLAAFTWIESRVGDAGQRGILFDMDLAIQSLRPRVGDEDAALVALTGSYHNLLRLWGGRGD
jgi:PKHD-type hydroxylase